MIVSAVLTSENLPGLQDILNILLVAVVFYALAFAAAFLLPLVLRPPKKEIGTYRFVLSFTNIGFVGYPVVGSLFGSNCVFYAAVLALPFNLLLYTLGPVMLSGGKGGKLSWKGVFSPCMLASLAALIVALTPLRFPVPVVESLDFIGDMSIPLALMLLGSILAALPLGQMLGSPKMWLLTFWSCRPFCTRCSLLCRWTSWCGTSPWSRWDCRWPPTACCWPCSTAATPTPWPRVPF